MTFIKISERDFKKIERRGKRKRILQGKCLSPVYRNT